MKLPLVLASGSPRRKKLLEQLNLPFITIPAQIDETPMEGGSPEENAIMLAERKALSVARLYPEHIVVGADTMVVLGEKPLGKPRSPCEAMEMLRALSDKEHLVITAISVVCTADRLYLSRAATTRVKLSPMSHGEIEAYVATGEPMDKAGAYGIQGLGAAIVERIEGCYNNVVGLPINMLTQMLREAGVDIWKLRTCR